MPSPHLGDIRHNKHNTWHWTQMKYVCCNVQAWLRHCSQALPGVWLCPRDLFLPGFSWHIQADTLCLYFFTGYDVKKVVTSSLGEDPGLREPGWPFNWVLIFLLPLPTQSPSRGTVGQVLEHLHPFFMAVMVTTGGWMPSPFTWNMHTLQPQIGIVIK